MAARWAARASASRAFAALAPRSSTPFTMRPAPASATFPPHRTSFWLRSRRSTVSFAESTRRLSSCPSHKSAREAQQLWSGRTGWLLTSESPPLHSVHPSRSQNLGALAAKRAHRSVLKSGDLMYKPLISGGTARRLWAGETELYRQHLLRLDPESRRNRFGGAVSDEFIRRYAEPSALRGVVICGFFVDGVLRGAAELRL